VERKLTITAAFPRLLHIAAHWPDVTSTSSTCQYTASICTNSLSYCIINSEIRQTQSSSFVSDSVNQLRA